MAPALAFVALAFTVKSAQDTKKTAREQARVQKRVADANARKEFIARQRAARARIAKVRNAQSAQGAEGSAIAGNIIGQQTLLSSNQAAIEEEALLNRQQIDLGAKQTVNQANAQIGQAIGTFSAAIGAGSSPGETPTEGK